jgi:hypothetical protein
MPFDPDLVDRALKERKVIDESSDESSDLIDVDPDIVKSELYREITKPIVPWYKSEAESAFKGDYNFLESFVDGFSNKSIFALGNSLFSKPIEDRDLESLINPTDDGYVHEFLRMSGTLIADLPFYVAGGALYVGGKLAGKSLIGRMLKRVQKLPVVKKRAGNLLDLAGGTFTAATFAGAVRTMFTNALIEADKRGHDLTFPEFFHEFMTEGLQHGWKSGVQLTSAVLAPHVLKVGSLPPIRKYVWGTLAQWGAWTTAGAALHGEWPTLDQMKAEGLLFMTMPPLINAGVKTGQKVVNFSRQKFNKTGEPYDGLDHLRFFLDPSARAAALGTNKNNLYPPKDKPVMEVDLKDMPKKPKLEPGQVEIVSEIAGPKEGLQGHQARIIKGMLNRFHPLLAASEWVRQEGIKKGRPLTEAELLINPFTVGTLQPTMWGKNWFMMNNQLLGKERTPFGDGIIKKLNTLRILHNEKLFKGFDDYAHSRFVSERWDRDPKGRDMLGIPMKNDLGIKRARRVVEEGKKGGKNTWVIEPTIWRKVGDFLVPSKAKAKKTVSYEEAFDQIFGVKEGSSANALLEMFVEGGLLSKDVKDIVQKSNPEYVPTNEARALNKNPNFLDQPRWGETEALLRVDSLSGTGRTISNPLRRRKGKKGTPAILSPTTTLVRNTYDGLNLYQRNKFVSWAVDYLHRSGLPGVHKITTTRKTVIGKKRMAELLGIGYKSKDVVLSPKQEAILRDYYEFFEKGDPFRTDKKGEVSFLREGKKETWHVGEDLAEAMLDIGLGKEAIKIIKKLRADRPTRWMRAGAVLAPLFPIKNWFKDSFEAAVYSKNKFIPIISSLYGLGSQIMGTKNWKRYQESGAMMSTMHSLEQYATRDVYKFLTEGRLRNQLQPGNSLHLLRIFSNYAENSARVGDFILTKRRLEREGKWNDEQIDISSAFEAKRLTLDFSSGGTITEAFNHISGFFTARVKGWERFYEVFTKRPTAAIEKAFLWITIPTIALFLHNRKYDAYWNADEWKKDLFWGIVLKDSDGEMVYTILAPKPFPPLGTAYGSLPERMLQNLEREDPDRLHRFAKDWVKQEVGTIVPNILIPWAENFANKNMYFDVDLIPRKHENVLDEYAFTKYTSITAQKVSEAIAAVTPDALRDVVGVKPVAIDSYVGGWGSTLGRHAIRILDEGLKKAGVKPVHKEYPTSDAFIKSLGDNPWLKGWFIRYPSQNMEPIRAFWDRYYWHKARKDTFDKLIEEGQFKKAQRFERSLIYLDAVKEPVKEIRELRKAMDYLVQFPEDTMSIPEQRRALDKLIFIMLERAKEYSTKEFMDLGKRYYPNFTYPGLGADAVTIK